LLGLNPPNTAAVRLARRGAQLVGNTLQAELTRAEVEALVFDGFLPTDPMDTPVKRRHSALLGFGLPFEGDPAITHHLGQFLREHAAYSGDDTSTEHGVRVDAVLFNGGFFKSPAVCAR